MLSALYPNRTWLLGNALAEQTDRPEVRPTRSLSYWQSDLRKFPAPTTDRDRTVSRRSEPSSRATLMGEQPNPGDLLQPQDVTSRHRGAKPFRRYELLGMISLLSLSTLSLWAMAFHAGTTGSLCPVSYLIDLSVSQSTRLYHYTLRPVTNRPERTFGSLVTFFGGDHPNQTTHHTVSSPWKS